MSFEARIRNLLVRALPQEHYGRLAKQYLQIRSHIIERGFKLPSCPLVEADWPLMLIAQPPRSGGTLLRNLFDNHPNCHAFPHELTFVSRPNIWGEQLSHCEKTFKLLQDDWVVQWNVTGIDKNPENKFMFSRRLHERLFLSGKGNSKRQVLDDYLISFFQSWLNYSRRVEDANAIVAFSPIPVNSVSEIEGFFSIYPDGYRIQMVRNPLGWWASDGNASDKTKATRQDPIEYTKRLWMTSVKTGMTAASKFQRRYLLFDYDALITEPENSLKSLCDALNLPFSSELLVPTLNGVPRKSMSTYGKPVFNFDKTALNRWREKLDPDDVGLISELTSDLYRDARKMCINSPGK